MEKIETMTLEECCKRMRELGFPIAARTLADGIEDGTFPFGDVLSKPGKRRRNFRIYVARFEEWARALTT